MSKKELNERTIANLEEAFSGESQAATKYEYFAKVAQKEGHHGIARVFNETAHNEKQHAKMWFKHLGHLSDTVSNLKSASGGENYEWTNMYDRMAKEAEEDGLTDLAREFKLVANVEREHEKRYNSYIEYLMKGTLYSRDKAVKWECLNCGHQATNKAAPSECPTCRHPQGFFIEIL